MEDGVSGDLELLYRRSRDEWKASDFHTKCDNKGATITVIRSNDDFIFGGFSDKPWISANKSCNSDKAFLFYLKSPSNEVGLTNMRIRQGMCYQAICQKSFHGPIFGGGRSNLHISSDDNNNSNEITSEYELLNDLEHLNL